VPLPTRSVFTRGSEHPATTTAIAAAKPNLATTPKLRRKVFTVHP